MSGITLFSRGRVLLVRTPIDGRFGINKLYCLLAGGALNIAFDPDEESEIWIVTVTRNRKRLRILHADELGMTLIIRMLWGSSKFMTVLDGGLPKSLTASQLRFLILTGSYEL